MCQSQISGSTKDHFAGENEVCEISQTHKKGCEITSQQKADFAALRSWLSACGVRLPTTVTPLFQLWILHRLKNWIDDFLIFETKYIMHKLDFRKCSKSGWHDWHKKLLHGRFLFASPPCIPDLLMAKDFKAFVLHVSEFSIDFPWIPNNSPQSHMALVIKKLSNTKT